MTHPTFPDPPPPAGLLRDDVVELRLLRVLAAGDTDARPVEARFLACAPEIRFAIHRLEDGARVGRIHIRLTDDATVLRAVGHGGYEVDPAHRRQGYAVRALRLMRGIARHYGVAPLWVLIAPENTASRRTAEGAGMTLVDVVPAAPEALAMGLEPRLCRYVARHP